jgi:hypothetical protein
MLFLGDPSASFGAPIISSSDAVINNLDVRGFGQLTITGAGSVIESLIGSANQTLVVTNQSFGMVFFRTLGGNSGQINHPNIAIPQDPADSPRIAPGQSCILRLLGTEWEPMIQLPYDGAMYSALSANRYLGIPGTGSATKIGATFGGNTARIQWIKFPAPATLTRVVTTVTTAGGLYDVELYPLLVQGNSMRLGDVIVTELSMTGALGVNTRTLSGPVHLPQGTYATVLTTSATAIGLRTLPANMTSKSFDTTAGASHTHWTRGGVQGVSNQFSGVVQSLTTGAQVSQPPIINWGG